ncbi:hypothetical protein ACFQZR_13605 [Paenibacillus sp. GCM10027629]|uniref:hypothetical protein n=1 Tax=Paenibacillus sp. GCM10027629 TaxID=3273414 RepID=UPI00362D79AA
MSEEKESIQYLIEYFEKYLKELHLNLQDDHDDLFLQGKIKGVQDTLRMTRIHERALKNGGQFVDVIID